MVTKYITNPLGMGETFAPSRKEWIAAAIGAVGGIASSLIGGISASNAAKEAEKRQRDAEARENAWYLRRYNEDYLDTAAGQNLVRRAKEYAKENWKKAAGAQAVAGGTDAATAMAKEAGNKMVGDTIANIAAADTQRKANVDNIHMANQQKFSQMDIAREQQRAQNITNTAQNASNAIISGGAALDAPSPQAPTEKKTITGGNNNGTAVTESVEPPITLQKKDGTTFVGSEKYDRNPFRADR